MTKIKYMLPLGNFTTSKKKFDEKWNALYLSLEKVLRCKVLNLKGDQNTWSKIEIQHPNGTKDSISIAVANRIHELNEDYESLWDSWDDINIDYSNLKRKSDLSEE